jgi:hypothetical protein
MARPQRRHRWCGGSEKPHAVAFSLAADRRGARGDLNLFAILAAQTDHYIYTDNFVTIRWHRSVADDHIGRGDIHKFVTILDVEVMMFGIVRVEIRLRRVDSDLSQQANFGKLIQCVVDRGK